MPYTCSICTDDLETVPKSPTNSTGANILAATCGHLFHVFCLENWESSGTLPTNSQCPCCRKVIQKMPLFPTIRGDSFLNNSLTKQLEAQIQQSQLNEKCMQEKYDLLRKDLEQAKRENSVLASMGERNSQIITKYMQTSKEFQRRCEIADAKIASFHKLQSMIDAAQLDNDSLGEYPVSKSSIEVLKNTVSILTKQLRDSFAQNKIAKEQQQATLLQCNSEANAKVGALNEGKKCLENKIAALETEIQKELQRLETYEKEINDSSIVIKKLQEELAQNKVDKDEHAALLQSYKEANQKVVSLNEVVKYFENKVSELETERIELKKQKGKECKFCNSSKTKPPLPPHSNQENFIKPKIEMDDSGTSCSSETLKSDNQTFAIFGGSLHHQESPVEAANRDFMQTFDTSNILPNGEMGLVEISTFNNSDISIPINTGPMASTPVGFYSRFAKPKENKINKSQPRGILKSAKSTKK